ncbi:unnamed protein product [Sphagnum troendelagicum]|uniref:U6 snRNA-associated Sm-like protein LSm4 n=1 Tax=Sphagnum troendelagicum TaxID=128251 RepID=A0ABP0TIF1_9BRYO
MEIGVICFLWSEEGQMYSIAIHLIMATRSRNENLKAHGLGGFEMFDQLVELKNGETYNGHLVNCDTWMNIHLREVICTSKDGDHFWRMPECYIRGNTIKHLWVPDEVIDKVQEETVKRSDRKPTVGGRGRGRGRGEEGGWGGGGRGGKGGYQEDTGGGGRGGARGAGARGSDRSSGGRGGAGRA